MGMIADLCAQIPAYAQMQCNLVLPVLQGASYVANVCIWTFGITCWVTLACELSNKSRNTPFLKVMMFTMTTVSTEVFLKTHAFWLNKGQYRLVGRSLCGTKETRNLALCFIWKSNFSYNSCL